MWRFGSLIQNYSSWIKEPKLWLYRLYRSSQHVNLVPPNYKKKPSLILLDQKWKDMSNPFSRFLNQVKQKNTASSISLLALKLSFEKTTLFLWFHTHHVRDTHQMSHLCYLIPRERYCRMSAAWSAVLDSVKTLPPERHNFVAAEEQMGCLLILFPTEWA